MAVPLIQQLRVGAYVIKQWVKGNARYPLVLMLEPLFRCNLACPGCGKIDYEEIFSINAFLPMNALRLLMNVERPWCRSRVENHCSTRK